MSASTRQARMTKGPIEARAQRLSAVLDKVLPKVSTEPPIVQGRTSAVESVLSAKRDEIERALELGYRPGTIARLIHEADDVDTPAFSKETIRLAIVRMAKREQVTGKAKTSVSRPRSDRDASKLVPKASLQMITPSPKPAAGFAGFEEDPR